jgi:tRNA dimethylallyltransferase
VLELSGRPFSATLPAYESVYAALQIGVRVPRALLDERIADRVRRMWQAGFVAEVRSLEASGLRGGRTASRALGYAQVLRFLDGGWSQEQAAAETVRATRRFARRQESWFRRDPRVMWLPAAGGNHGSVGLSSEDLAGRALDTIRACGLPRATERETTS